MIKNSSKLLFIALLAVLFVSAAIALAVVPETLLAKVPLGRSGLIFYLAGGALIFWLSLRKGGAGRAADAGRETTRDGAEEPLPAEEGDTPERIDELRERIRVRKGRKHTED